MKPVQAMAIPGIPETRVEQLQQLWRGQPGLQAVWLFGSRAMGRHGPGSDIDLCLEGPALSHNDRLAKAGHPWAITAGRTRLMT